MATAVDSPIVLVTGANEYLGTHIVKVLLDEGYKVKGTVRNLYDEEKKKFLQELCPDAIHPIELIEIDLLNEDSVRLAVKDCTYVIHSASPCLSTPPSSHDDVLKSAVQETKNVLKACSEAGSIKRVVMTSSIAAIQGDLQEGDSEEDSDKSENTHTSDTEIESFMKKLYITNPLMSAIVTTCQRADLFSVDFNDAETEIAYALGDNCIYIAPINETPKQIKRTVIDETTINKKQRLEEEDIEIECVQVPPSSPQRIITRGTKSAKISKVIRTPKKTARGAKTSKGRKGKKNVKIVKNVDDVSDFEDDEFEDYEVYKEIDPPSFTGDMKLIRVSPWEKVHVVKFLPDKPYILAACSATVKLFNTETDLLEKEYSYSHSSIILDIDVNSTAEYFATASKDMTSCLYDFQFPIDIRRFDGHIGSVNAVKFHRNGLYVATGSSDTTIRLYNIEDAICVRIFIGHKAEVSAIACSPDGKMIASGDDAGVVIIWDIKQACKISEVPFYSSGIPTTLTRITSLCFHAASFMLTACCYGNIIKCIDVRNPDSILKTLNVKSTPLLIKFSESGSWKMVLKNDFV